MMIKMVDNLLEIAQILSKRFNQWWAGTKLDIPAFRRRDFHYLKKELDSGKVITLIGPRQVGKSTVVKQLIFDLLALGIQPKRILYVQLDDVQLKDLSASPLQDVLKAYELHVLGESLDLAKAPIYLFLDEVQRIENWAEIVKGYNDNNKLLRFVCTGSASFTITQKSSETLPGRQLLFTMFPLKFADTVAAREYWLQNLPENPNAQNIDYTQIRSYSHSLRSALFDAWEKNEPRIFVDEANKAMIKTQGVPWMGYLSQYLVRGGYPEIVLSSDLQKIQNTFKGYALDLVLKDLMPWFQIRDVDTAEHLLYLLAASSGSELSYSEFSQRLRGIKYLTIKKYVGHFEQLNVISLVYPYTLGQLGSPKNHKVYFNDVGFRNAIVGIAAPETQQLGAIAETALHDHLERLAFKLNNSLPKQVFYYKTKKAEIDFVIRSTKLNKAFPLECKFGQPLHANQEKLLREFAEQNNTFAISTTPNTLAQRGNLIEAPLWLLALLC